LHIAESLSTTANGRELEERVQALFKNPGYLIMEVKSLRVKPFDPTGVPKLAMLEADVLEGPRFRLAEIKFTGNQLTSSRHRPQSSLLKLDATNVLCKNRQAGNSSLQIPVKNNPSKIVRVELVRCDWRQFLRLSISISQTQLSSF
jgi:hypothetical protein